MGFKPIYYTEEERGKNISRRYLWTFEIDGEYHQLELFCSFLSSKRVVILDGVTLSQSKNFAYNFEWRHQLNGYDFLIRQEISLFPLFIDNLDFIQMLQQQAWGARNQIIEQKYCQNTQEILKANGQLCVQSEGESKTISNIKMSDFQNYPSRVMKWTQRKPQIVSQSKQISLDLPQINSDPYKDMILLLDEDQDDFNQPYLLQQIEEKNKPMMKL